MNMPFQTFDEQSDASECAPRLAALRAELAARGLDGFLVPRADEHQGEYVPKRAERLAWLTGFTGSAGMAIVLMERGAIFVDGRYTLQVRNQTDTSLFETLELMNDGPANWIEANLPKGARLGYDPWLHTQGSVERLKQSVERAGGQLVALRPIRWMRCGRISPSRRTRAPCPTPSSLPAKHRSPNARGWPRMLKKRGADAAILTLPDSICWLLNIRGADVPHTPFRAGFRDSQCGRDGRSLHGCQEELARIAAASGKRGAPARARRIRPRFGCAERQDRAGRSGVGRVPYFPASGESGREDHPQPRSLPIAQGLQERRRA